MIGASWLVLLEKMSEGYKKLWQTSPLSADCHDIIQRCPKAETLQFIFKLLESPPSHHPPYGKFIVAKKISDLYVM